MQKPLLFKDGTVCCCKNEDDEKENEKEPPKPIELSIVSSILVKRFTVIWKFSILERHTHVQNSAPHLFFVLLV
jgi:hypothetical protein